MFKVQRKRNEWDPGWKPNILLFPIFCCDLLRTLSSCLETTNVVLAPRPKSYLVDNGDMQVASHKIALSNTLGQEWFAFSKTYYSPTYRISGLVENEYVFGYFLICHFVSTQTWHTELLTD